MWIIVSPSPPQPKTATVSPGSGGDFSTACIETEKGSASAAVSLLTESGIGKHIDSCAGR